MPTYFWKKNGTLKNKERFKVACFTFVNGLPRHLLLEWCHIRGLLRDKAAYDHINYLYDKFENTSDYDTKYWQWNVAMARDQYINGQTHYYSRE